MIKKIIILIGLLILSVGNVSADPWISDSTIVNGLDDVGTRSSPATFEMNNTWYLISGERWGGWCGWHWTGSAWVGDSDIVSGLTGVGEGRSVPTVFKMNNTWYLISGAGNGYFYGWHWTGSTWVGDSDIVSGLTPITGSWTPSSSPRVFKMNNTWYLISGLRWGGWCGWHWTGSAWVSDSDIISGLSSYSYGVVTVFKMGNTWYLINGAGNGYFYGWHWTGSTWVGDSDIVSGLSHVWEFSAPIVFETNDMLYLISGAGNGLWYGWNHTLPESIHLSFIDNCGNLLKNIEYATAREGYADYPLSWHTTASGSVDIFYEDYDYLEIRTHSAIGELYYNISNPSADIGYTILNPAISWNNNIMVVDGNTSGLDPISGALVSFFQDCIIDPSVYPSRNKFTDSTGIVNFEQCELDSFYLGVSADSYKSFSGNVLSYMDAFQLSQTILIKLYPIGDEENETEFDYTDYNTNIYFKDVDGNYTTSILDTDNYVDLYYYNNNSDGEAMTLKFQKYSIETGIIDLLSWNIPIDTAGYKRILKSNYTDTSYLYIGYLYNYSIDGWDKTEYLNIRNETSEIDLNYENLTAFLWFKNKNPEGSIDYREDIEIIAYANTTYVGLFNISLELYDNSSFITHVNLTWADFIAADLKYYYEWNPLHSYINGHNYTVRMHGYDYYLLDMDYVNATDYRKNKLTIIVKDRSGANLDNSFIFLEGYGSLSTGDSYYNSYEDLVNGNYRYKASKSGYSGTGWDEITLADGDEIVTYILISDTANTTHLPQKTSDEDIQAIFFPLMFALLIFILIGAFKYVCE